MFDYLQVISKEILTLYLYNDIIRVWKKTLSYLYLRAYGVVTSGYQEEQKSLKNAQNAIHHIGINLNGSKAVQKGGRK